MENKIIIDGMEHKVSDTRLKLIKALLPRQHVSAKGHESVATPTEPQNIVPEHLTDAVVKRLVGHKNVWYYNLEIDCPVSSLKYKEIKEPVVYSQHCYSIGPRMNDYSEFYEKYEVVAPIAMTIPSWQFRDFVRKPRYRFFGRAIVGNLIVRNKKTGKLELYCKEWYGSGIYSDRDAAVYDGVYDFITNTSMYSDVQADLIAAHKLMSLPGQHVSVNGHESAVVPEKLTKDTLLRLVGHENAGYHNNVVHQNDVLCCNTEKNYSWNTHRYNGHRIKGQNIDTDYVKKFKTAMNNMSAFSENYQMVAPVTMTMWFGDVDQIYRKDGARVIGNIIVRNKKTGKLELYCEEWPWISDYITPRDAARNGANRFAFLGAASSRFQQKLLAAHKQQSL